MAAEQFSSSVRTADPRVGRGGGQRYHISFRKSWTSSLRGNSPGNTSVLKEGASITRASPLADLHLLRLSSSCLWILHPNTKCGVNPSHTYQCYKLHPEAPGLWSPWTDSIYANCVLTVLSGQSPYLTELTEVYIATKPQVRVIGTSRPADRSRRPCLPTLFKAT